MAAFSTDAINVVPGLKGMKVHNITGSQKFKNIERYYKWNNEDQKRAIFLMLF
jgi:hypothetical protein